MSDTAVSPFVQPRPPVPAQPLSLFGFLRAIGSNPIGMWPQAAYEQDVVERRVLSVRNVMLNAPDAVRHVLMDHADNYRRSRGSIRILRPLIGNGLLLSQGEEWRHQRRTTAPALAPRVLPMLARHMVSAADDAIAQLSAQAGGTTDLLASMQALALEVAGRSMFSLGMQQHGATMRDMLHWYGQHHSRPHLLDIVLPPGFPVPGDFGRRRFQRRWMEFIETIMRERTASQADDAPRDLFDLLRAAKDPETGVAFSHEVLRDQVATLILGGHETTAVTLFWASMLLASSPAVQQRVADEVHDLDITADNAMTVIPQLVYTRAVVNETLRLYPPAFMLMREAIEADRIGELTILPGTAVMISPWVLHHHRKYWRDPDVFDPSRFLPDATPPDRFTYLPFGIGPRVCVGAQFALTEATLVLARLIQTFRLERLDATPVLPLGLITTHPDHAPPFRLTHRLRTRSRHGRTGPDHRAYPRLSYRTD